jgi:hypothetical protein
VTFSLSLSLFPTTCFWAYFTLVFQSVLCVSGLWSVELLFFLLLNPNVLRIFLPFAAYSSVAEFS